VVPNGTITMYSGEWTTEQRVTALPIITAELLGQPDMTNLKAVMSDTALTTDTGVTAAAG